MGKEHGGYLPVFDAMRVLPHYLGRNGTDKILKLSCLGLSFAISYKRKTLP